jgi:hypothetical protein
LVQLRVLRRARREGESIAQWMLRATGDPNRPIKIETDPITGKDIISRRPHSISRPAGPATNLMERSLKPKPSRPSKRCSLESPFRSRNAMGYLFGWTS